MKSKLFNTTVLIVTVVLITVSDLIAQYQEISKSIG